MSTEKDFDQQTTDTSDKLMPEVAEGDGVSRRKFTRNVLVGSAVLLTLSNRSAWGKMDQICASANLLDSYRNANPSRLNDLQSTELDTYNKYLGTKYQKSPEMYDTTTGDMCYDVNLPNDSSTLDKIY